MLLHTCGAAQRYGRAPLGFDSLGKWVGKTLGPGFWQSSCLQVALACLGQGEVSSFSASVSGTLNTVMDHPFCQYLLASQLDFVLLMPQALMQDSTGVAQPVLSSWCRTSDECLV